MVKKSVLEKLSNRELEKYLQPQNRFTPEAVQMAFEILIRRGKVFSDNEKHTVERLIVSKKNDLLVIEREQQELSKNYLTEDESAVRLYPRELITISSFILGFFYGSVLLAINCFKLKKQKEGLGIIFLGIIYSIIQHFGISLMYKMKTGNLSGSLKRSPELLSAGLGSVILYFIWIETIRKTPYRKENLLFPVILGLIISALIYINYNGYSPSYIFSFLAKYKS